MTITGKSWNFVVLTVAFCAAVAVFIAGCSGPNGNLLPHRWPGGFGDGWIGPLITGVTVAPETGPYLEGDNVTFTVAAQPTGGGTLSYSWDFGDWATGDGDLSGASEALTLGAPGTYTGTVMVTETLGDNSTMDANQDFSITVSAPAAP